MKSKILFRQFFAVLFVFITLTLVFLTRNVYSQGARIDKEPPDSRNLTTFPSLNINHHLNQPDISYSLLDTVTESWVRNYNGPGNNIDIAYDLALDALGNVYVTGWSPGNGTSYDYATIKYDALGNVEWVARYNGLANDDDKAVALAVDASGNVYVTGNVVNVGVSPDAAVTIKYNSDGIEQWTSQYSGIFEVHDIAVDNSGNVFITGAVYDTSTSADFVTVKYNTSGVEEWAEYYNGLANDWDIPYALAVDDSGNVYVTGYGVFSTMTQRADFLTIKYSASGNLQWAATYNGIEDDVDVANDLAIDTAGNLYVTGKSKSSSSNYDYLTIKYNPSGNEEWVARYNGPENNFDEAIALTVDDSSNVYVTGSSYGSTNYTDYATIKYSSTGSERWVSRYDGTGLRADIANAITIDAHRNVYVTGMSRGSGTWYDYVTIKYDASGVKKWIAIYNGIFNDDDMAYDIAVDNVGNVYVTGGTSVNSLYLMGDYTTIKYTQNVVGVEKRNDEMPAIFFLQQNYPNPFNPATTISFSLPITCEVTLKIFDCSGKEIAVLVSDRLPAGTHSRPWNPANLASGVYFYQLQAGDHVQTKKLILLR